MKIDNPTKETLEAIAWCWDEDEQTMTLDKEKRIQIVLRDAFFVETITVLSGYESVDETIGRLFYSKSMWRAGSPATFMVLKTGRIWFIGKHNSGSLDYEELLRKIVKNPEMVAEIRSVSSIRAAANLFLEG